MSGSQGGIEGLYPFLYADDSDIDAVMTEVERSTVEKGQETRGYRELMLTRDADALVACAEAMTRAFHAGGRLFAFGNGGSSTDAHGIVQTFLHPPHGRGLPAYSLTADVACVTALANDVGFEVIFARQIAAAGRAGDIAVGLSTSGGSDNVLQAFQQASRTGLVTVGLAGYDGGRMAELVEDGALDHLFVVPSASIHRIQESQTTVYNVLWELVQRGLTAIGQEAA